MVAWISQNSFLHGPESLAALSGEASVQSSLSLQSRRPTAQSLRQIPSPQPGPKTNGYPVMGSHKRASSAIEGNLLAHPITPRATGRGCCHFPLPSQSPYWHLAFSDKALDCCRSKEQSNSTTSHSSAELCSRDSQTLQSNVRAQASGKAQHIRSLPHKPET